MIRAKHNRKNIQFTVFGIIITIIILSPIYFIITYGFETTEQMLHVPPYFFPPDLSFENYRTVFNTLKSYMLNNIIIAVGCLGFTLLIAPLAAFSLSHYVRKMNKLINVVLLMTQMFPVVMIAIPMFLIYNKVGLINTFPGIILADATYTIPFATLVLSAYFRSVPFSLVESAIIDGASHLKAFLRIIIPISRSGIITVAMLGFLMAWSDFIYALSLTTSERIQPISIGIFKFMGQYGSQWPLVMSGGFLYTIPPLVFVLFGGRYIVSGLSSGAIKQ